MNSTFDPTRCPTMALAPLPMPWRRIAAAAAGVLMAASLAACGPKGPETAPPAAAPLAAPVADATPAPAPITPAPATSPAPMAEPVHKPAPIQSPAPARVAEAATPPVRPPAREVTVSAQRDVTPVAVPAPPPGQYGRVTGIQTLRSEARSTGTGAVIGGVLGGVLGHQVGGGNGRTAATAIGAVGGAVVGSNVEKNRSRDVIGYRVNVQLDNGQTRSVTVNSLDGLNKGDRVRYANGHLFHA